MQQALEAMTQTLLARPGDGPWAIIGIRRGGDHLAERLASMFEARLKERPPVGAVDITLYRDDGFGPHDFPQVGVTHINFDTAAYTIVLVDDVLYTGRTVRAALDVILDYGRPRAVRLAVLVDRGSRELPICADVAGIHLTTTTAEEHVEVRLHEAGAAVDAVAVKAALLRRKT